MKIIIKYHGIYAKTFRLASEYVLEAARRALIPVMNDLLSYVRTYKLQGNPLYTRPASIRRKGQNKSLAESISIETRISGSKIFGIMGTDMGWIETHERGAIITPETAPKLKFPLYERGSNAFLGWRVCDSVTIPKRSVIGSTIKERKPLIQQSFEELFARRIKWFMAKSGGLHVQ